MSGPHRPAASAAFARTGDDLDDALARAVVRLRFARGWTQRRLADEAGLTRSVIATLEARPGGCTFRTAWAVSAAFGVPLEDMIRYAREEAPGG